MVLAVALAKDTAAFLWTTMVAARVPSRNAAISPTKAPSRARSSVQGGWEYGADLLDQSCGSSNDFVQTKILGRFGFRIPGGFGLFCRRDALSRFEEPELVLNRQLNFCHPPSDSINR